MDKIRLDYTPVHKVYQHISTRTMEAVSALETSEFGMGRWEKAIAFWENVKDKPVEAMTKKQIAWLEQLNFTLQEEPDDSW